MQKETGAQAEANRRDGNDRESEIMVLFFEGLRAAFAALASCAVS
jgi:hypothetical protein